MRGTIYLPLLILYLGLAACSSAANQALDYQEYPTPGVPSLTPSPSSPATSTPIPAPTKTQISTAITPSRTPTPAVTTRPSPPACLVEGGRIITHTLRTEISPWPWEFRVYQPPCYEEEVDRRYPTLVLIHGSTFNDDQWDRLGADEAADRLIASGELAPFLILMPRDRRWVEPVDDPFGTAVVDFLIPWMDENYRTLPERQYRAIGGLSRGAAWAVHLGLQRWDLFSAIGGHSLPVFRSDSPYLRKWLEAIPPESMPRIYLDIGERDYLIEAAIWFENLLNDMDVPHEWYLYPGRHEESYWTAHMETYLRWYAQEWPLSE